jgi:hypothetical protein
MIGLFTHINRRGAAAAVSAGLWPLCTHSRYGVAAACWMSAFGGSACGFTVRRRQWRGQGASSVLSRTRSDSKHKSRCAALRCPSRTWMQTTTIAKVANTYVQQGRSVALAERATSSQPTNIDQSMHRTVSRTNPSAQSEPSVETRRRFVLDGSHMAGDTYRAAAVEQLQVSAFPVLTSMRWDTRCSPPTHWPLRQAAMGVSSARRGGSSSTCQ